MRRHTHSLLLFVSLCLACGCTRPPQSNGEETRDASRDQASLITAAQDFLRAFDNMEWEPFRAAWGRAPTVFFPFRDTPERVEGAAVEERFRQFFDEVRTRRTGPPYLHLAPRGLQAEAFGRTGIVTFMLGQPPGEVGRRTLLFAIENGEWKLIHLHASVAEP